MVFICKLVGVDEWDPQQKSLVGNLRVYDSFYTIRWFRPFETASFATNYPKIRWSHWYSVASNHQHDKIDENLKQF